MMILYPPVLSAQACRSHTSGSLRTDGGPSLQPDGENTRCYIQRFICFREGQTTEELRENRGGKDAYCSVFN